MKPFIAHLSLIALCSNLFLSTAATAQDSDRSDILVADFEGETYGNWKVEGEAFGSGPAKGALGGQMHVSGFKGKGLVNSFLRGDRSTGTLTSPEFTIERPWLNFLIGGGGHPGKTCMNLVVDGKIVRTATGLNTKPGGSEQLESSSWDVAEFAGKTAVVQIVDQHTRGWGHINVDQIVQSTRRAAPVLVDLTKKLTVTNTHLKDEWSTFPFYDQVGYDQALRPQFHFTSRMGWLNDPNGMVYYDGEWHMLFQHFAKGNANGPKSWGNAVSTDLMHWQQLPHAINPYAKIDDSEGIHAIWSGSAVVDVHNALGKQKGDTRTLFVLYSATHEKFFQGGAYSTDKGRTWTKINDGKPVIPHQEGFSKGQRDPRIFYYEPGDFYVTIMMIGGPDRLVRLWKSTNLLDWEVIGDIPNKAAECIDMYHVAVDGDPDNRKWVIADAGSHYEVGDFDGKTWSGFGDKDKDDKRLQFDYGDAWYAAQAFNQGPDGRVVHVGWLHSKQPGYRPFLQAGMPFTQQMSIPIEIALRTTPDGIRMFRNPVKEIEKLYHSTTEVADLSAGEANKKLSELAPELIDLTLKFEPKGDFTLNVRGLPIRYVWAKQEFQFTNVVRVEGERAAWRKKGPYRDTGIRAIPATAVNGKVILRVLVDRASLELFVNDGLAAASFVVVPDPANRRIVVEGKNELKIHTLVINELKSAWGNGVAPAPPTASAKSKPKSELPRLPENVAPASQDFKAQKLLPYLKEAYVSTSPVDLDDGISVGELSMPGAREAVAKLVAADKRGDYANLDSLLLWRDGKLIFEYYNRRGSVNGPHYAMSVTKTMTSVVLARAIELGHLKMEDLDKPVIDFMPEIDRSTIQPGVDTITIRDALMMKSGLRFKDKSVVLSLGTKFKRQAYFQKLFETTAPVTPESKQYKYTGSDPSMVMMIIDIRVGGRVQEFIRKEVMEPVGAIYNWPDQPCGIPKCGAGGNFTSRTLLKIGVALSQGGKWNGTQLLSSKYIEKVTDTTKGDGYFYYFHNRNKLDKNGKIDFISGIGAGGQYMSFFPDLNIVMVATAHNKGDISKPLDALDAAFQHLIPLFR